MQALRRRAVCAVRHAQPTRFRTSRSYASESHHHAGPEADEGLGTAFYVFAGALPVSFLVYSVSRPGKDGEPSSLTKWLGSFDYFNEWEARNNLRTAAYEQAAKDKHLFYYAERNSHVELKMPELINSGAPWNVPAGHYPKLDHVTEHYRKQHEQEEARKVKKLEEKKE